MARPVIRTMLGRFGGLTSFVLAAACSASTDGKRVAGGSGGISGPSGGHPAVGGAGAAARGGIGATGTGGVSQPGSGGITPSSGGSTSGGTTAPSSGGSTSGGTTAPSSGGATSGGTTAPSSGGSTNGGTTAPSSGGATSGGTAAPSSGGSAIGGTAAPSSGGSTGGVPSRHQAPYPTVAASTCGSSWTLVGNVCCAQYCADDNKSESCSGCGGPGAPGCTAVNAKGCMSGEWAEVHSVSGQEPWHYSRSTHFGLTSGAACGFGLYGLCMNQYAATGGYAEQCRTFCAAYPDLCRDPPNISLRGNYAAPQGNYYSQFWPSLPGDRDNYLSCGECFELVRTRADGTDYDPAETGYTPPILLQVVDSCPCAANSKWCCGSGRDHCGEIQGTFKFGCQLPPSPPDPPLDHDPLPNESIHFDLSDIAMSRLQTGTPDGAMPEGVIPTRYRRVPCPMAGNIHVWLKTPAGPYWFSLVVVNVAGLGSVAQVEAQLPSGDWVALLRDPNYTSSRPQERSGTWVTPQGSVQYVPPVTLRFTDGSGRALVASGVIKTWEAPDPSQRDTYYIDTGVQF